MRLTGLVLCVLTLARVAMGQQCALDLDGSGTTTVNELIVAVNQALHGCGAPAETPTPISNTSCTRLFTDARQPYCSFVGNFMTTCGVTDNFLMAFNRNTIFDPTLVNFRFPPDEGGDGIPDTLWLFAEVLSPTTATLTYGYGPNDHSHIAAFGTAELLDGGARLRIAADTPSIEIRPNCRFSGFDGRFVAPWP